MQHWTTYSGRVDTPWRYETLLSTGELQTGLTFGAEFHKFSDEGMGFMFSAMPDDVPRIRRQALKAHPAWMNVTGWAIAHVDLELPAEETIYFTYYPGKENGNGDGITLSISVNDDVIDYRWVTGDAGWKERVVVDLSAYAGEAVTLSFKVGWGEEELGDEATTAYDSLVIGDPKIVRHL